MSWASRRRTTYLGSIILFFALLIGIPITNYILSIEPTCFDGAQNQDETAIDQGGPCLALDPLSLSPSATLWARSFKVRDGSYTAVAYIANPNLNAGATDVHYHVALYDSDNILVAERDGTTFIMPGGGITPVLITGLETGNRVAVHTIFQITERVIAWKRMMNPAAVLKIRDQKVSDTTTVPRITARVDNTSFAPLYNIVFVAVAFDPFGNSIAASRTALLELGPNSSSDITFTWPQPFSGKVGRVDIIPLLPPLDAPPQMES